jgi:hypothetical protein
MAMSEWPEFAKWLAIGVGIVFVVSAAVLSALMAAEPPAGLIQ